MNVFELIVVSLVITGLAWMALCFAEDEALASVAVRASDRRR